MKYPQFLKEKGTIAFVAPSFGAAIEPYKTQFESAIAYFKEKGFNVDLGPNVFLGEGLGISSTPENCAKELEDYYLNHGDVIISVGGGELMCETIEKLSIEKFIEARPKWYMGYSDNTNFSFLLSTMFDTASFYGPHAGAFGTKPLYESLIDSFNLLTGKSFISHGYDLWESEDTTTAENPLVSYNLTEKTEIKKYLWNGEKIEGRFIGGCLDVLNNLCGTRFDKVKEFCAKYKNDGIIWFLEACEYNPMRIRRGLWQLKNAGWFENVKAFVFGRPMCAMNVKDDFNLDEYKATTDMLEEFKVPIVMDCDIGHLPPAMTMVNGGYGILSPYKDNNIQIEWKFIETNIKK